MPHDSRQEIPRRRIHPLRDFLEELVVPVFEEHAYLHALIEAGKDIEALSLLGQPEDEEPGFYDWLRGLALHRAGDFDGAEAAFTRYFDRWPGDILGISDTQALD